MAENNTPNPQYSHPRKPYPHNHRGGFYRGRGRGGGGRGGGYDNYELRPNVGKAVAIFGVRDLREYLDRKHEEDKGRPGPPPDPPNNFLKDPSREVEAAGPRKYTRDQYSHSDGPRENNSEKKVQFDDARQQHRDFNHNRNRGGYYSGRERGRGSYRHPGNNQNKAIKDPVNIKIELSTSTGERNCVVEEDKKIADIKHVPDRVVPERRSFRGRGRGNRRGGPNQRGGYRGKSNSPQAGHNSKSDHENSPNNADQSTSEPDKNSEEGSPVTETTNEDYNEEEQDNYKEDEVLEDYDEEGANAYEPNSEREVQLHGTDELKINIDNSQKVDNKNKDQNNEAESNK